jgi:oligosaccharide:H+ symporter
MSSERVWFSTTYFLYFAALSAIVPFIALYYQSLGLTGGQVGILLGVPPLVSLFASPLWTGIADARNRHKLTLLVTIAMAVFLMAIFPAIRTFALALPFIMSFAFFSAPIMALVDNAILSKLGSQRDTYGRVRLWGTVGWGLGAPIAGAILQRYGLPFMFWMYAGLMALNLISIQKLDFIRSAAVTPFWKGVRTILNNRRWALFMLMAFISTIGFSAHTNYLSLLFEEMGASKTLIGIAVTISIISELPVMFFSSFLLRKFKARGLLAVAMFVAGLRCILYYFSGGPQTVLVIQLLHGLTFPALWIAGVTYAAENAPPGFGATAQGLFGGVLLGFGAAAGSLLGGVLIDRLGVAGMYGTIGIIVLSSLVLMFVNEGHTGNQTPQAGL